MLTDVVRDSEGEKVLLLGNEAIARGAIEAGIDVFAAYPGTPSSEIADTLSEACRVLRGKMDFYMEYSANEKVALEVAIGASLAGKRAMATMKHVGVNVAADALFSFAYVGARGGFVLVTADDPSMHSSQNEQDNRWYGKAAKLPVVEPSSVQEAKDYTKICFDLSEKFGLPMILRSYTRLSHASGVVELGKIPKKEFSKVRWDKHPETDVVLPAHARKLKLLLLEKLDKIEDYFNKSEMNWIEDGDGDVGIIACGLSYAYTKEALENLGLNLPVLKLSSMHPLPEKLIDTFASQMKEVIVVEEVDPFVELHVRAMGFKVYGKMNGYMPMNYENNTGRVETGIAKALGIKPSRDYEEIAVKSQEIAAKAPPRPPVLCPGCPHSASFYAIRKVVNELGNAALPSDIGCYTLGINKPLEGVDITICMGASVGTSNGLAHVLEDKIIATIGDSTFIHAGIPALINAVYNNAKFVLVILDNSTTGMTGHQPHPGTGVRGCGEAGRAVKIENIVRGCGVDFVEVVNPYNIRKMIEMLKRALEHDGVAVVIARQPCAILWTRARRREGKRIIPYTVTDDCTLCMECINTFACPALIYDGRSVSIDPSLCVGCAVCAKICPNRAIKPRKSN